MKVLISIISFGILVWANVFDVNTYQSKFKQTVTNNSQQEILYKGELFLKSNGNVLWKYQEPFIKNVYISNARVVIDEPELEQAIISDINNDLNLLTILKESIKIDDNTYENTINEIKYTIKIHSNDLKAIFYTDEIGNNIKIVFNQAIIDKKIPDEKFMFTTPLHYDVIRK